MDSLGLQKSLKKCIWGLKFPPNKLSSVYSLIAATETWAVTGLLAAVAKLTSCGGPSLRGVMPDLTVAAVELQQVWLHQRPGATTCPGRKCRQMEFPPYDSHRPTLVYSNRIVQPHLRTLKSRDWCCEETRHPFTKSENDSSLWKNMKFKKNTLREWKTPKWQKDCL